MSSQNITIFGDPAIDTRFVVELAGARLEPFGPFRSVFKTNTYHVHQQYWLYHVAGIPSSSMGRSSLQAPDILKNLYSFTRMFGPVHLLI
jgi:hypothetical protein